MAPSLGIFFLFNTIFEQLGQFIYKTLDLNKNRNLEYGKVKIHCLVRLKFQILHYKFAFKNSNLKLCSMKHYSSNLDFKQMV